MRAKLCTAREWPGWGGGASPTAHNNPTCLCSAGAAPTVQALLCIQQEVPAGRDGFEGAGPTCAQSFWRRPATAGMQGPTSRSMRHHCRRWTFRMCPTHRTDVRVFM